MLFAIRNAWNDFRLRADAFLSRLPMMRETMIGHAQKDLARYIQHEQARARARPDDLINYEKRVYSQTGEDGILEEIFRRIGTTHRCFVEFGIGDGQENCSRFLLEKQGWRGLWLEADRANVQAAQPQFSALPVTILERFVTRENILQIFQERQVLSELDLLVIDIDGNDYWVWERISQHYRPRVLVIEYNASLRPGAHWVIRYDPLRKWDLTCYFGASLSALTELSQRRGYTLVGCNSYGVNAFFVRDDLIGSKFPNSGNAKALYCAPKYGSGWFGHPPCIQARKSNQQAWIGR